MDVTWVKIRVWHIVRTATRMPGRYLTICGRSAGGPEVDQRPGSEATCESCYRIAGPK